MENVEAGDFHVPAGTGEKLWVADELMTFVVSGGDTDGRYAVTDSTVPPGGEAPPHVHHREDEALWVLEGEVEVTVGDATVTAGPGSFVRLPRGVPHAYANTAPAPVRFLTLMVPAGLEGFFREVGKPATDPSPDPSSPPPFGEDDLEKLLSVAPRYGVEILPPPQA
jgi:quercetin dioxygenase-like cupin family protein